MESRRSTGEVKKTWICAGEMPAPQLASYCVFRSSLDNALAIVQGITDERVVRAAYRDCWR
jgi:hypothetical protein